VNSGEIGVFDSGVGGLAVLTEIRALLPSADLFYVADQAFAPYGERGLDNVRARAFAVSEYLIREGASTVVVACNSASAAALHELRERFPTVSFVGMEPAVKPAAGATRRGTIGVLATEATFQGALFASVVDRHARGVSVIARACSGLAAAIEDGTDADGLIRRYTADVVDRGADTIVLGCTHYSFVADRIRAAAGVGIEVIDPASAVARQTARVRSDRDATGGGSTRFLTTGDPTRFATQIARLVGISPMVDAVEIPDGTDGRIVVVQGDITSQPVDVIVNAANAHLAHGGGVAAAIARAGGPAVDEASRDWVATHGPVSRGGAAVTTAGAMAAGHVVHVVGPVFSGGPDDEPHLVDAVRAALDASAELGAHSVAIPAISAGIYGYPPADACRVIVETAEAWLREGGALNEIRLVAFDEATFAHFDAALNSPRS
jgi:glutamate racemase